MRDYTVYQQPHNDIIVSYHDVFLSRVQTRKISSIIDYDMYSVAITAFASHPRPLEGLIVILAQLQDLY